MPFGLVCIDKRLVWRIFLPSIQGNSSCKEILKLHGSRLDGIKQEFFCNASFLSNWLKCFGTVSQPLIKGSKICWWSQTNGKKITQFDKHTLNWNPKLNGAKFWRYMNILPTKSEYSGLCTVYHGTLGPNTAHPKCLAGRIVLIDVLFVWLKLFENYLI